MSDLMEPSIETGCQGVEKLETVEEYQGIDSGRRGHRLEKTKEDKYRTGFLLTYFLSRYLEFQSRGHQLRTKTRIGFG